MTSAEKTAHVRRYFELLTASVIDCIISLFDTEAHVVSPFIGQMNLADFFKKLGDTSSASKLTVFDVLVGEYGDSATTHFEYDWTLKNGDQIVFQGVDYFNFSESGRFASLPIFYDTSRA
ncbi:hypothetical protein J7400_20450 [Shimia sp. R9_2]|uniref:nuclear transport factor 2 family protein n=1 Tax=Shimia sp. R9_2 TaxID=2821112 RepID=UPI001ADC3072|nr:nuclear transport factor 2 family protein [Shimia sp. R9_2]MBO9399053.1 hypothetical protein [Shimia sp. R9_2]